MCVEKSREGQSNQCQVLAQCQGRIELSVEFSDNGIDHDFVENSCTKIVRLYTFFDG